MKRDLHAAVIGVNAYSDGIAALQSAVHDARAVAELLEHNHGYTVDLLLDEQADLFGIEDLLQETLPQRIGEDTALLLYFAGHGIAQGVGGDELRGYLLPQDARPAEESTWLSMDVLRAAVDRLPCRHLLVILDCCFGGTFRWATTRNVAAVGEALYDGQLQRFLRGTAWHVLTSAAHNERAFDVLPGHHNPRDVDGEHTHSPFASALLEGLAGEADAKQGGESEGDGVITVTELYQFLFKRLVPAGGGALQTPGLSPLKPESTGEFVFLAPNRELSTLPDPPLDPGNNPWLGLAAYSAADRQRFFGRQAAVEDLCRRLRRSPLVVVIGASGSGKSSLVRAGVIPRLQEPEGEEAGEAPFTFLELPRFQRVDPIEVLDRAVEQLSSAGGEGPQALLIDQFEELFTQCESSFQEPFMERLAELVDSAAIRLVLTVRSDFEPRLRASRAMGQRLARALVQIPPPSAEDLRQIIEGPAKLKALFFEPQELVERMVEDVLTMPGALPMLSFALSEMYRQALLRRQQEGPDRALTEADFEAVGGVVGSLHNRATALLEQQPAPKQEMIRWIFLRMVADEGGRLARRRISERELVRADAAEDELVGELLESYKDARLITSDDGFVEPGHDTLVVAWPRLLRWLEQAGPQDLWRDLWRAAKAWHDHPGALSGAERRGLLWTEDPRLGRVVDPRDSATRLAQDIGRSRRQHSREAAERRQRARQQLNEVELRFVEASLGERSQRRRWRLGSWLSVCMALVGVMVFTWQESGQAVARDWHRWTEARGGRQARAVAEAVEAAVRTKVASLLLERGEGALAGLVALEVEKPGDVAEHSRLLHRALSGADHSARLAHLPAGDAELMSAAWNPRDDSLATLAVDGRLEIREVAEWAAEAPLAALSWQLEGVPRMMSYSPNGALLLTASWQGPVQIWRARSGERVASHGTGIWGRWRPMDGAAGEAQAAAQQVLVATEDGRLELWDPALDTSQALGEAAADSRQPATWSPDGRSVLAITPRGELENWHLGDSPARIALLPAGGGTIEAVDWARHGQEMGVAALWHSGEIKAFNGLANRDRLGQWENLRGEIAPADSDSGPRPAASGGCFSTLAWHPSRSLVLAVLRGGPAEIVEPGESRRWMPLQAQDRPWLAASWSPDGRRLLTVDRSAAYVWDTEGGKLAELSHPGGSISGAAFSPRGHFVLIWSARGSSVWAAATGVAEGLVRANARRCLSPGERQLYLSEREDVALGRAERCGTCLGDFFDRLEASRRSDGPPLDVLSLGSVYKKYRACLEAEG